MTATYDPSLNNDISKVRQKIGDTDVAKAQVQDETITAYRAEGRSILSTARQLCLDLAAKWASVGDVSVDDQMQRTGQIAQHYRDLAASLGTQEVSMGGALAGGIIVGGLDDCSFATHDRWDRRFYF